VNLAFGQFGFSDHDLSYGRRWLETYQSETPALGKLITERREEDRNVWPIESEDRYNDEADDMTMFYSP